jgi:hypothetical protein
MLIEGIYMYYVFMLAVCIYVCFYVQVVGFVMS